MLREPFLWHGEHISVALPGARALFTTRRGGVSTGPYASLNLGRWTADDPLAVRQNRARLEEAIGARLAFGRQVHGHEVHTVRMLSEHAPTEPREGDGVLTDALGVAPMVLTADCLPIAVAGGGAVAMLHAGWRGLAQGIVPEGVGRLRELVGEGAALAAAIGPGAGPCCYVVSEDVHARFAVRDLARRQGERLDLKAIARLELQRAGVGKVHDVGLCTICAAPSLFFSHRRDGGQTGRQCGVAWRQ